MPLKKPISMMSQSKSTPAAMMAMMAMVFRGSLYPSGCMSVKKPRPTATMTERYIVAIHQPVRSQSCRRLTLRARLTHRLASVTAKMAIDSGPVGSN
jgi:hypothetical protein